MSLSVLRTRVCAWSTILEGGTWCALRIFDAMVVRELPPPYMNISIRREIQ